MKPFLSILTLILSLFILASCNQQKKVNIWLIGDSTMAAKKANRHPESGWGEGLKMYTNSKASVHNHAASGRSTLSFITEKRWQAVLDSIQENDFVIMQFGHNDEKQNPTLHTEPFGTFQKNIRKFIDETLEKGATPVVCSSIVRRQFNEDGTLKDTHGDYITAAKKVALETQTPYVDMETITRKLVTKMGPEKSKEIFNYTAQKQDSTHVNIEGAEIIAGLFVHHTKVQDLSIAAYFE